MSNIGINDRVYLMDIDDFAIKQRTMLGIKSSAVIKLDNNNNRIGYIGNSAKSNLVNITTELNEMNQWTDIPLDWKTTSIALINDLSLDWNTQVQLTSNLDNNWTKQEKRSVMQEYLDFDKNDVNAWNIYVGNTITMLMNP